MKKESLKNGWISLKFLFKRYGEKQEFEKYQGQLSNQGTLKYGK